MTRRKPPPQEQADEVPAWIVSFSDMITLLLAFFVLLQAFAHQRDPELFFAGQGSFRRAISGMGIPDWLYGRQPSAKRSFLRIRYPMEETPETEYREKQRNPDNEDENIRRIFQELSKIMEARCVDIDEKPINVVATPIQFTASSDELNEKSREYLKRFAMDLIQSVNPREAKICVVGFAKDVAVMDKSLILSTRRAEAVERYLLGALRNSAGGSLRWRSYSWGAGAGGSWSRAFGIVPDRSYIVLAVMKAEVPNGRE